jgi:hypothetical protein
MSRCVDVPHQASSEALEPYQQLLQLPAYEQTCAKLRELVEAEFQRRIERRTSAAADAALSQIRLSSSRPS